MDASLGPEALPESAMASLCGDHSSIPSGLKTVSSPSHRGDPQSCSRGAPTSSRRSSLGPGVTPSRPSCPSPAWRWPAPHFPGVNSQDGRGRSPHPPGGSTSPFDREGGALGLRVQLQAGPRGWRGWRQGLCSRLCHCACLLGGGTQLAIRGESPLSSFPESGVTTG